MLSPSPNLTTSHTLLGSRQRTMCWQSHAGAPTLFWWQSASTLSALCFEAELQGVRSGASGPAQTVMRAASW